MGEQEREGGKEGGREGGRAGEREGGREGGRERGREGGREKIVNITKPAVPISLRRTDFQLWARFSQALSAFSTQEMEVMRSLPV